MHYREIAEEAIRRGLWSPGGETPWHTLNAAVRANALDVDAPRRYFVREGNGYISLALAAPQPVRAVIERHRAAARTALLNSLQVLHPREFENLVSVLLARMGMKDVETTRYSQDGGIDVRARWAGAVFEEPLAVQVKRVARPLGAGVVRALRGDMADGERGVVVSTSAFHPAAHTAARESVMRPVSLIDGTTLAELFIEHRLGVRVTTADVVDVVGFDVDA
jgi:restriction endonuclease Mrr